MTKDDAPLLDINQHDGVLWLTKKNVQDGYGMSLKMLDAMHSALNSAAADPSIRAIIIDAGGRGFHSGAIAATELQPQLENMDRHDFKHLVKIGHAIGSKIAQLPKPVLGIARSGALGGGLEILLRCDFIYCLDSARFSFPEVTLGFVAAWGGTQLSARLLPYRRAQEMLLLGEGINGTEAQDWGLVSRSFSDNEALVAHIESVLERLRLCSPASLKWTKECLSAAWHGSLQTGLEKELEAETETMATGDFLKGLSALREGSNFDFIAGKAVAKKTITKT